MLKETLEQGQRLADAALDRLIPLETEHPVSIHKAMRHSVFAGGKRLRPGTGHGSGTDGCRLFAQGN